MIPGCQGNAHWAERGRKGWCSIHYQRWRRSGDPQGVRTPNGDPMAYMLAHMWDDCPKWPFYRHKCGYGEMTYRGMRGRRVHRIVCELVYGPPPTPKHVAAHNCGKGSDGCFGARCVRWKTQLENSQDARSHGTWLHGESVVFAKLTEPQVLDIFAHRPSGRSPLGLAGRIGAQYGVTKHAVWAIWGRKNWAWLTAGADG